MESFEREILAVKTIFLYAGNAVAEPPLGTVLGNLGVNTVKFCKEFNKFTETLPNYLRVRVIIWIFDNYSFYFKVKLPTTGLILDLLKYEAKFMVRERDILKEISYNCINLVDIVKLAKFKFPALDIKCAVLIIMGTVKSKKLKIIQKNGKGF